MERTRSAANPLARLALSVPPQTARAASIAGRIFGAALAIAVAFDQSYDPTQVFTVIIAGLVLATLVPITGVVEDLASAVGAGLVFFAGSVLTHLGPGLGMLAMGLIAFLGAAAWAHRHGRGTVLPGTAFVAAVFIIAALQVAVVFLFE